MTMKEQTMHKQCLLVFHFHPSLTLRRSHQVVLLQKGDNALLADLPRRARAYLTATLITRLIIVLATETRAVPLAMTRTREHETITTATTDDMIITNLIEETMITEEIMTVTAPATVMTPAKDAATFGTATATMTAVVTVKNGIMTADAISVTIMTVTVAVIAHHVDVREVVGGTTDHGHLGVVHVSILSLHELKSFIEPPGSTL
jgi:hypothetical protein